jgi:putative restriction endonuclease
MAHCVFMHKADSIYDDIPAERSQFPAQYLGRAEPCIGDWLVYLEPSKVRNPRGYVAVAKVEGINVAHSRGWFVFQAICCVQD